MNAAKPISVMVAALVVMSFSGALIVSQASAQEGYSVTITTSQQAYPTGALIALTVTVQPTPTTGNLIIQIIDPRCSVVSDTARLWNSTSATASESVTPYATWINGTYTVIGSFTDLEQTSVGSATFQYGAGGAGQCAELATASGSSASSATQASVSTSTATSPTPTTVQTLSASTLTVSSLPQVASILGNEGVELTYSNNGGASFQALVWMTAHNSQGQTIGIFASEIYVQPNTNVSVFIPIFALPAGNNQVSIFATTFQGIAVSSTTPASISI